MIPVLPVGGALAGSVQKAYPQVRRKHSVLPARLSPRRVEVLYDLHDGGAEDPHGCDSQKDEAALGLSFTYCPDVCPRPRTSPTVSTSSNKAAVHRSEELSG
jgi:hypothetical protein